MDKCCKVAALYIASLKAIAQIHQHNHWTVNGDNFYELHLLFERLYDATLENLDMAAEEFIGLFGEECLNYSLQAEFLNKVLLKYNDMVDDPVAMSLKVEKDFITFSKEAYNCFEAEGKLSLGLDDMIMSIAKKHEEALYLLQQSS